MKKLIQKANNVATPVVKRVRSKLLPLLCIIVAPLISVNRKARASACVRRKQIAA